MDKPEKGHNILMTAQKHCKYKGCWCHADIKADTMTYYERKRAEGLITDEHLTPQDVDWIERDKIAEQYAGYPPMIAKKLQGKMKGGLPDGIELQDLIQAGYESLLKNASRVKAKKGGSSFLYKWIMGDMKAYIRQNMKSGVTGVSAKRFWEVMKGDFEAKTQKEMDDLGFISTAINSYEDDIEGAETPEDALIAKEKIIHSLTDKQKVREFFNTLSPKEMAIIGHTILLDRTDMEKMTTRQLAESLGYRSPQTVINLRNKILDKAREYFNIKL